MARSRPATVAIPTSTEDRPQLARVGLVAAAGFAIGIAWPWLAGVRLAPSAPANELAGPAPTPETVASIAAPSPPPAAAAAPETETQRIRVGKANVTSCRTSEGKTLPACDPIALDPLLVPRLEALGSCANTAAAEGTLSLGFRVNFETQQITHVQQGKSTTVKAGNARALLGCAEELLAQTKLDGIVHANAVYTVFYQIDLTAAAETGDDATAQSAEHGGEIAPASGMATVAWVSARVRAEPDKSSPELSRLLSGTRVKVLGRKGDWYRVGYNSKGDEGWVFKSAIGL